VADDPLVSYSQHGEDIVLLRALANTDGGFYVDVGAYDPTEESVTRLFYERGWRGVNIDPSPEAIGRFEIERPDEINLAVAAGDRDGETEFFVSDVPGWSTTNVTVGEGLDDDRHVAGRVMVPMRRLSSILDELPERTIDFLKVDAEGSESDVIAGLDLGRHRPRVVVLEGVAPVVGDDNIAPALERLVAAGYLRAGFDGLNHYLTTEPELIGSLSSPANPTDGYVRHGVLELQLHIEELRGDVSALQAEVSRLHASWEQIQGEREQLAGWVAEREGSIASLTSARNVALGDLSAANQELEGIKAGLSWRVTAPIRLVGNLVRPGRRPTTGHLLSRADALARRFPTARERAILLVERFPAVAALARRFLEGHRAASRARRHVDFDAVTPRRRSALAALEQRERERRAL
jgi:FkbM family methyltransferase